MAGLLAGLLLPEVAAFLRPYIPELVTFLLFLTACRIGHRDAFGVNVQNALGVVLVLQLMLPILMVLLLTVGNFGLGPLAAVVVLVLAAPSVTGAPNFTQMVGGNPAEALRILVLGTAILPLTALPVFLLLPQLGDLQAVLAAAARLMVVVIGAVLFGFAARHLLAPDMSEKGQQALDGATSIALAVIVVALMSAIVPAFRTDPALLLWWLAVAFAVNFGMQIITYSVLTRLGRNSQAIPAGIIAGNRNIALFLVALPAATTDPLLIFIGCYQIPMYLTPILLKRFYDPANEPS
ncbi:MAG: hypothetical protein ACU0BB_07770 [Paracoccaceae bacterium]